MLDKAAALPITEDAEIPELSTAELKQFKRHTKKAGL